MRIGIALPLAPSALNRAARRADGWLAVDPFGDRAGTNASRQDTTSAVPDEDVPS
ncbi:hypothetical protein [Lentzea cavernae]|uniref:Uncharacterized protein n=1 Tax=Lentzea cavernae TaxID=2020703 RepID=A0ABQ3MJ47_9PSEU|nr:hypothetical protein [Lentzea cavernae]GHH43823.1 hypothetical protein GCM10017774_42060 [Lentzea cavernae]